jgi:membrane-associated protein
MQGLVEFWHRFSDLQALIQWGGYIVLTAIVFAETGLLVGFFLPGDSLLVTAGLLASQGFLNVYVMGVLLSVAAIVGQSLGYAIGKAAGPRLFAREDSLLFKRSHLLRAHSFYEKHGGKTVILARFMPIVRTFVPVVAGAAQMRYRDFTVYNMVGGVLWVWSMLLIGYVLGRYIPGVEKRIDLVIVVVVLLSISPGLITWLRSRRSPRGAADTAVVGPRTTFSEE